MELERVKSSQVMVKFDWPLRNNWKFVCALTLNGKQKDSESDWFLGGEKLFVF